MTPRERFLKMPPAKAFADIAASEPFKLALDYAMLELQEQIQRVTDDAGDRLSFSRLQGASHLRRILETIAFPDDVTGQLRSPTINHDAYNRPSPFR